MSEFTLKALDSDFDVAIVDYMLDAYRGPQVAKALEGQPTLLVSQHKNLASQADWPEWIKGFLSKQLGAKTILKTAIELVQS